MKRITIMMVAAVTCALANAACVDWKVSGAAADNSSKVYLLTSVSGAFDSVAALEAAAISVGTIKSSGRAYDTGTVTASGSNITADTMSSAYFAIVAADGKSFNYIQKDLSAYVYDPDKQESSKGFMTGISASSIAAGASKDIGGGNVPEPTTGILILVGLAGLGLKRKVA